MSDKPFINNDQAIELILRLINEDELIGKINDSTFDAFVDMYERGNPLSAKQLLWVQAVSLQLHLVDEPIQNEWSSKTLQERERIRGKEVATPPALLNKALRPPHRMHELDKKKDEGA